MFERYTERARRVIFFGRYEASQLGSSKISPEHLLLGLTREDKALFARVTGGNLDNAGIIKSAMLSELPKLEANATTIDLPLTDEAKRILALSLDESERLNHRHVGTEHQLLALLKQGGAAAKVLNQHGITWEAVNNLIPVVSVPVLQGLPVPTWRDLVNELLVVISGGLPEEERELLEIDLRHLLSLVRG